MARSWRAVTAMKVLKDRIFLGQYRFFWTGNSALVTFSISSTKVLNELTYNRSEEEVNHNS